MRLPLFATPRNHRKKMFSATSRRINQVADCINVFFSVNITLFFIIFLNFFPAVHNSKNSHVKTYGQVLSYIFPDGKNKCFAGDCFWLFLVLPLCLASVILKELPGKLMSKSLSFIYWKSSQHLSLSTSLCFVVLFYVCVLFVPWSLFIQRAK